MKMRQIDDPERTRTLVHGRSRADGLFGQERRTHGERIQVVHDLDAANSGAVQSQHSPQGILGIREPEIRLELFLLEGLLRRGELYQDIGACREIEVVGIADVLVGRERHGAYHCALYPE